MTQRIPARIFVSFVLAAAFLAFALLPLAAQGFPTDVHWRATGLGATRVILDDLNRDGYADLVVGGPDFANGQSGEGGIFVYYGSATGFGPDGTPTNSDWRAESDVLNARLGTAIAVGDFNCDGHADIVASAIGLAQGSNRGLVLVWFGSLTGFGASGTLLNADWRASMADSAMPVNSFGLEMVSGNFNGDVGSGLFSCDDLVVSDQYASSGAPDQDFYRAGKVWLWYGSPSGLGPSGTNANADWDLVGRNDSGRTGRELAVGNTSGDSFDDLAIGAGIPDIFFGDETGAHIYVFRGGAGGLPNNLLSGSTAHADWELEIRWIPEVRSFDTRFVLGDLTGDGADELVVNTSGIEVLIYAGGPGGLNLDVRWSYDAASWDEPVDIDAFAIGDVNSDGPEDLAWIGWHAPAHFFFGVTGGGGPVWGPWFPDANHDGPTGRDIAIGDVNGDTYQDIALIPRLARGEVWIYPYDVTPPELPAAPVTEVHGVAHNTWQNYDPLPSFTWLPAQVDFAAIQNYLYCFDTSNTCTPTTTTTLTQATLPTVTAGTYYFRLSVNDTVFNQAPTQHAFTYKYDPISPTLDITYNWLPGTWYSPTFNAILSATATDEHSGLAQFTLDGTSYPGPSATHRVIPATSGQHDTVATAVDHATNQASQTITFLFDKDPPEVTFSSGFDPTIWYSQSAAFTVTAYDEHVGLDWLRLAGTLYPGPVATATQQVTFTVSGIHNIDVEASDLLNQRTIKNIAYKLDLLPPFFNFIYASTISGPIDLDPPVEYPPDTDSTPTPTPDPGDQDPPDDPPDDDQDPTDIPDGLPSGVCQTEVAEPTFHWSSADAHSGVATVIEQSALGTFTRPYSGSHQITYGGVSVRDTITYTVIDRVGHTASWSFDFCYVNPDDPGDGRPTKPTITFIPPFNEANNNWSNVVPQIKPVGGGLIFGLDHATRYELDIARQGFSSIWYPQDHVDLQIGETHPADWTISAVYSVTARVFARLGEVELSSRDTARIYRLDITPPSAPFIQIPGVTGGTWTNIAATSATIDNGFDIHAGISHYLACLDLIACTPTDIVSNTTYTFTPTIDGEYNLRALTVDRATNESPTSTFIYRFDQTPPVVTRTSSIAQAFAGAVHLSWESSDNLSGLASHHLRITNLRSGAKTQDTTSGSARNWVSALPDGRYLISLVARDHAGNDSASALWSITVDTTPPELVAGQVTGIAQSPTFTATVTFIDASPITQYAWRVGNLYATTTQPRWIDNVPAEGTYTVEAQATDALGNTSPWFSVGTKVYDRTPPDFEVAAPEGVTNDPRLIFGNNTDVAYYVIGIEPGNITITESVLPLATLHLPITQSGIYTTPVTACDAYDNCTYPPRPLTQTVDFEPPEIITAGQSEWLGIAELVFTPVISDASPTLLWHCLTADKPCVPDIPLPDRTKTWIIDHSGIYTMHVRALDAAGNVGWGEVVIWTDLDDPVVSQVHSNGEEWQKENPVPTFFWDAYYDRHSGLKKLDGSINDVPEVSLPTTGNLWTAPAVDANGETELWFKLFATDKVGHTAYSKIVFRYDNKPPSIIASSSTGEDWQNLSDRIDVLIEAFDNGSGVDNILYCITLDATGCTPNLGIESGDIVLFVGSSELTAMLLVQPFDVLGNNATMLARTLRYDISAPRLTLDEVPAITAASTITVSGIVSDVAVATAYIELLDSANVVVDTCDTLSACPLTFDDNGFYTIRFTAVDVAGNHSELVRTIQRDAALPIVTLDAPGSVSIADDHFRITLSADKGTIWRLFVDNALTASASESDEGSVAHVQVDVDTPDTAGTFDLRVEVEDSLGLVGIATTQVEVKADADDDGLPDLWERDHNLNWSADDANGDPDGDGLVNLDEYSHGTDPQNPDTDGDGLTDGAEITQHLCTDPLKADTDGDGKTDGWELLHGSDPCVPTAFGALFGIEVSPQQQTIGLTQFAEVNIDVVNHGFSHGSDTLRITFPGGAAPGATAQGWTLGSGYAEREISLAALESDAYTLYLSYPTTGSYLVEALAGDVSTTSAVDVIDVSWITLEDITHPDEVAPGGQVIISGRVRNTGASTVPSARLSISFGDVLSETLQDLAPYSIVDFSKVFTAPDTVATTVPINVTAVNATYNGEVTVIGALFDVTFDCSDVSPVAGDSVLCDITIRNNGNQPSGVVARFAFPTSVTLGSVAPMGSATAWVDGQTVVIQKSGVAAGTEIGASIQLTPRLAGQVSTALELTPPELRGDVDLISLNVSAKAWPFRSYLPLVLKVQ